MKVFQRFAFLTTVATYLLIFMGGLVRVSGAGLGCPDWPKCFGRWFPPTSIDQLPPDIDPSRFNITLAWIEYINRLAGMTVGILILITALLAIKHFRNRPRVMYPSLAAAILVAFEGWQGSVVVGSELQPLVVTVHMILALVIVSLLIFVTQEAHYLETKSAPRSSVVTEALARWSGVLWGVAIIQIAFGTLIRSALEVIAKQEPLLSGVERLAQVGAVNHVHTGLGLLLLVLTWFVGTKAWRAREDLTSAIMQTVTGLMAIVTLQIVIGLIFIGFEMTSVLRIFHLLLASLYVGLALLAFTLFRKREVTT